MDINHVGRHFKNRKPLKTNIIQFEEFNSIMKSPVFDNNKNEKLLKKEI